MDVIMGSMGSLGGGGGPSGIETADVTETLVTIRTTQESVVAVPEACLEKCRQLGHKLGLAALDQLQGNINGVVCDNDERRRHSFPRNCPAIQACVKLEGTNAVSPFIIGEGETRGWVDRVDDAIIQNGALTLTEAYRRLGFRG